MATPPRIGLSLVLRILGLKAPVGKPRKSSSNSHMPLRKMGSARRHHASARPASVRRRNEGASACQDTGQDRACRCRRLRPLWNGHIGSEAAMPHRYDHIDLPPIRPIVTRIELFGGHWGGCGRRYRAHAPAGMEPRTPFGPQRPVPCVSLQCSLRLPISRRLGADLDLGEVSRPMSRACAAFH